MKALEWRVSPRELSQIPAPQLIALEWHPEQAEPLLLGDDAPTGPLTFEAAIEYARKVKAKRDAARQGESA